MAFDLIGRIKIKDDGASRAFDKVRRSTEQAQRASKQFTDANERLNRAQATVSRGAGNVSHEMNRVERATKGASKAMGALGTKMKGVFGSIARGVGRGALYTGLAAIGTAGYVGVKSLNKAMDFEAQMSTIEALTGASKTQMAEMQGLALKMGANTRYAICLTAA